MKDDGRGYEAVKMKTFLKKSFTNLDFAIDIPERDPCFSQAGLS